MSSLFLAALTFLVIAYAADYVTMAWHRAREAKRSLRTAVLSGVLEAISWSPILVAISVDTATAWACAVASVIGSCVGTWHGMSKIADTVDDA